jgi:hypothetical protein
MGSRVFERGGDWPAKPAPLIFYVVRQPKFFFVSFHLSGRTGFAAERVSWTAARRLGSGWLGRGGGRSVRARGPPPHPLHPSSQDVPTTRPLFCVLSCLVRLLSLHQCGLGGGCKKDRLSCLSLVSLSISLSSLSYLFCLSFKTVGEAEGRWEAKQGRRERTRTRLSLPRGILGAHRPRGNTRGGRRRRASAPHSPSIPVTSLPFLFLFRKGGDASEKKNTNQNKTRQGKGAA